MIIAIAAFAVVAGIGATAASVFISGVAVAVSAISGGIYFGSLDLALLGAGAGLLLFGLGILLFALTAAIYKASIRSGAFIFGAISGGRKKNGQI